MFRSSLQRLARPAGAIKVAPIVSQTRLSAQQISTRRVSAALQSRAPLYQFRHLSRAYSTESAQAVRDAEGVEGVAAEEGITLFKDLKNINVNPNLLEAITKDMRYERMTPVQAKTINPALKGTDM
jgi:ATP-dependent RNA helicase MSS116, mitochondrial